MLKIHRTKEVANGKSRVGFMMADGKLGRRGVVAWAGKTCLVMFYKVSRRPRPLRAVHLGKR